MWGLRGCLVPPSAVHDSCFVGGRWSGIVSGALVGRLVSLGAASRSIWWGRSHSTASGTFASSRAYAGGCRA